jgi:hypothetical protein
MSIGLVLFVAICQTLHYRAGNEVYLWMTRFWGKFLLISMAIGVVTGIVQEFQFGMNWSQYSRYVGDIFGAPLARLRRHHELLVAREIQHKKTLTNHRCCGCTVRLASPQTSAGTFSGSKARSARAGP